MVRIGKDRTRGYRGLRVNPIYERPNLSEEQNNPPAPPLTLTGWVPDVQSGGGNACKFARFSWISVAGTISFLPSAASIFGIRN
jgi:hypothetical protein